MFPPHTDGAKPHEQLKSRHFLNVWASMEASLPVIFTLTFTRCIRVLVTHVDNQYSHARDFRPSSYGKRSLGLPAEYLRRVRDSTKVHATVRRTRA